MSFCRKRSPAASRKYNSMTTSRMKPATRCVVPNTRVSTLGPCTITAVGFAGEVPPSAVVAAALATCWAVLLARSSGRSSFFSFPSATCSVAGALAASRCVGPDSSYPARPTTASSAMMMIPAANGGLIFTRASSRTSGLSRKFRSTAKTIGSRNSRAK